MSARRILVLGGGCAGLWGAIGAARHLDLLGLGPDVVEVTLVMSCQHGRPMGRFAGRHVVADLFGAPMLPLRIPWYVTVLDPGPWGAVYTAGWDRQVVTKGEAAKQTKRVIDCERIYPPLTRDRQEILAAAAPIVPPPPGTAAR